MTKLFEQSLQHKAQEKVSQQEFELEKNTLSAKLNQTIHLVGQFIDCGFNLEKSQATLKDLRAKIVPTVNIAELKKIQTALENIKAGLPKTDKLEILTPVAEKIPVVETTKNFQPGPSFLTAMSLFANQERTTTSQHEHVARAT